MTVNEERREPCATATDVAAAVGATETDFVHPTTGEVLTVPQMRQRLANIADGLGQHYRERDIIQAALAERNDPAAVPSRRARTAKQEAITHCPRCGVRLPKEPS